MASMVLKGSSSSSNQVSPLISIQEKGSRNKRKFRADPPLGDPSKIITSPQNGCPSYEFCAERFDVSPVHGQASACDLCGVNQDHSNGLKLDLGLSSTLGSSEAWPNQPREEIEADGFQDADWSDLTEAQLEELVLSNLDAIFKSAIKKIVACGYAEEMAIKAVLRSGLCYGCKDTVSNIVDNTLAYLRSGQDCIPSRDHCFEDLQQLEKYILAELVCVLREVRPFFSIGDAMWCLLICDMNVSHACAMDGDPTNGFAGDGGSNGTSFTFNQPVLKTEAKTSELNLPSPCKPVPSIPCSHSPLPDVPSIGINNTTKSKNSLVLSGIASEKDGTNSISDSADKTFTAAGTSQSSTLEEKFVGRKIHSSKREHILRQKSLHPDKNYRTYGSKGSSRAKVSGFGGLITDKKLKSVSDSAALNVKNASVKIKAMGADVLQDNGSHNFSVNSGPSSSAAFCLDNDNHTSPVNIPPELPPTKNPHSPALSTADTELSLSLPTKSNSTIVPTVSHSEASSSSYPGMPYGHWAPQDKKDEMILKLVPRVQELQNQLQEWTEWANQKVMQAACRLSKDKAELKTLRQEKEEVERLKKEKLSLEENTKKKLIEMDVALSKASGQVERANATVCRLEVENAALRQEMEAAKLHAAESAASCEEVSQREKKTLMKVQSWEKQKALFQEELMTEKRKVAQMLQELQQAKALEEQFEARLKQEEKAKEEILTRASLIRKEREEIETSTKLKEDMMKSKAETSLQKYKEDIHRLEKEISQLRLKTDSSKIAALRRGIDGSHAGRFTDNRHGTGQKESRTPLTVIDFHEFSGKGAVKRERECVMCLSEEMSVVFIPCAHQVVCIACNELHEKQGMKDCPSCRSPIQRRINVRYAHS
ncbi:E3 ubiquitin-protein ligase protein [Gossypium australe]|uniref:E3 ubiquitin-protein ligase protein n=1 Tax=Gossypium australe TaxID=47621 RepID=A0A5B6UC63_9ROSI|nr:E3 ubiquitin-protein ligase protein [Gossypium australe]